MGNLPEDMTLIMGKNPLPDILWKILDENEDIQEVQKLRKFFKARAEAKRQILEDKSKSSEN